MEWREIKQAIRADLLARNLAKPDIRLKALDQIELMLEKCFPLFPTDPKRLLDVGKQTIAARLAQYKANGNLNGAEKSILNDILARIQEDLCGPVIYRESLRRIRSLNKENRVNKIDDKVSIKYGLPPLVWENSRIIILGTLPGEESLRRQQYYANPSNRFWDIIGRVYGEILPGEYLERVNFLRQKGLALWDVVRQAEREGSLDRNINAETVNNIGDIIEVYASINALVFNGTKAEALFKKYIEGKQSGITRISKYLCPSTSASPGLYVKTFEEKVDAWKLLLEL